MVNLIVASTTQGVIGVGDKLPWRYSEDLRWFKKQTMGGVLIVGRKTYEGLPSLPGREVIVVSRNHEYDAPILTFSVKGALEAAYNLFPDRSVWIAGGGQVYASALSMGIVDRIVYTEVPDLIPPGQAVVFWPLEVLGQDFQLQSSEVSTQNPSIKYQIWCRKASDAQR